MAKNPYLEGDTNALGGDNEPDPTGTAEGAEVAVTEGLQNAHINPADHDVSTLDPDDPRSGTLGGFPVGEPGGVAEVAQANADDE